MGSVEEDVEYFETLSAPLCSAEVQTLHLWKQRKTFVLPGAFLSCLKECSYSNKQMMKELFPCHYLNTF